MTATVSYISSRISLKTIIIDGNTKSDVPPRGWASELDLSIGGNLSVDGNIALAPGISRAMLPPVI
jgi:hypothetical protein